MAVWFWRNPLRKPDAEVRDWLLTQTPLGLSQGEVRAFLDNRGWNEPGHHKTIPPRANEPFLGGAIGHYQDLKNFPFRTTVRAFWEFDSDGKLVDIRIDRWIDSP